MCLGTPLENHWQIKNWTEIWALHSLNRYTLFAEPHSHIITIQYQRLIVFSSSCEVCGWSYCSIGYWLPEVMTWAHTPPASAAVLWREWSASSSLESGWLITSHGQSSRLWLRNRLSRGCTLWGKPKQMSLPTIRHAGHGSIKCRTCRLLNGFLLQAVRLLTSQLKHHHCVLIYSHFATFKHVKMNKEPEGCTCACVFLLSLLFVGFFSITVLHESIY